MSDLYEQFNIKEFMHWSLYLHENQCYLGRLYLWAKRKDAIDFIDTTTEERKEFFLIAEQVNKALDELFQPDLMNYCSLGNVANHLHVHFIPRYQSPRNFSDHEFIDNRWGKNPAPYNKEFSIPETTRLSILNAIKKTLS